MLPSIPLPRDIVRPPETVLVNITPQETRVAMLEENNIYWNDDLEFVISAIIRYIRSIKADSDTSSDVVTVYQNNDDRDFANQLLKTAIIRGNDFDEIIEPLRDLFKDEVRALGEELGLDSFIVPPGLGDDAGVCGAIALANDAMAAGLATGSLATH